ncbi:MAG TPA: AbrB/MazE/SpoVT family DNA-binding domain-containing protein [Nitrososphaerales archaeon]|nr:AbrB/MazE/SpoVT family DNA-binding domain-containing protein [Nitrososphaerales archaeon]
MSERADVVVVSSKGQVVIPQEMRQRLGIGAKTKLLVYPYEDALVMKKLDVKGLERSLEGIYKRVDAKRKKEGEMTEAEIEELVLKYRHRSG